MLDDRDCRRSTVGSVVRAVYVSLIIVRSRLYCEVLVLISLVLEKARKLRIVNLRTIIMSYRLGLQHEAASHLDESGRGEEGCRRTESGLSEALLATLARC